ncbi:Uma2 family endonuclease [Sinosporangium siamense]|uniref:Putative restriction endonuclease domain-containing protein n=1 Tax=Sinosporangium siamense TaxID=1367973 RepID=A0A919V726_9ACTN|nr:Uma2 family endonuclease [Sinosporangium siamense]GII92641.1 hypothetical protein Ssi02_28720 [Sinosporangium siamense]
MDLLVDTQEAADRSRSTATAEPLDTYLALCAQHEKQRVEIIDGRVVTNPVPSIDHNRIVYRLQRQLAGRAEEEGWELLSESKIFFAAQLDRYEPDLIAIPENASLWDANHVHAEEILLAVEVVSPSSRETDHTVKPQTYSIAGIPLCLLIHPLPRQARLLSRPSGTGYTHEVKIDLGHPLDLPTPWKTTIDTAKLITS